MQVSDLDDVTKEALDFLFAQWEASVLENIILVLLFVVGLSFGKKLFIEVYN